MRHGIDGGNSGVAQSLRLHWVMLADKTVRKLGSFLIICMTEQIKNRGFAWGRTSSASQSTSRIVEGLSRRYCCTRARVSPRILIPTCAFFNLGQMRSISATSQDYFYTFAGYNLYLSSDVIISCLSAVGSLLVGDGCDLLTIERGICLATTWPR